MNGTFKSGAIGVALVLSYCAQAQLSYTVSDSSTLNKIKVKLSFRAKGDITMIQMPNWAPGSYRYANNWRRVSELSATVDGQAAVAIKETVGKLPEIFSMIGFRPMAILVGFEKAKLRVQCS